MDSTTPLSYTASSTIASTSEEPTVTLDCTATYSFFSVALLVVMAVIGMMGNGMLLGGIYWKREKWPNDIVLGAMAVLDMTFNLIFTPCIIWMNNYKTWVRDHAFTMTDIKYEAFVCCTYSLTTMVFLLTIGVTRYLGMRYKQDFANRPFFFGPMSVAIDIVVVILTIGISVVAPELYIAVVSVILIGLIVIYLAIYFLLDSWKNPGGKTSSTISTAQRLTTVSLFYVTVISVVVLLPCITTMFIWFYGKYHDMYFNGLSYSCATFIVTNVLHHPLMAINFSLHPYIILSTSSIYRNDCYIFLRKLSMSGSRNKYVASNSIVSSAETGNTS